MRLGRQIVNPLLELTQLGIKVRVPQLIGPLLILQHQKHPLRILRHTLIPILLLIKPRVRLPLHMIEHFLIDLFQAGSQLLVFFPNLVLAGLVVVG